MTKIILVLFWGLTAFATSPVTRTIDHIGASGGSTLTVPSIGSNLVSDSATQTLTNKTLSTSSTWNGNAVGVAYGGTALTATPTNGQIPIGNGSGYTLSTLTAGTGVTVSNGTGSVTVNSAAGTPQQDTFFTCNGSTTAFTLSFTPVSTGSVLAHLDGTALIQGSSYDYTVSGTTLTLNTACATGQRLLVYYGH